MIYDSGLKMPMSPLWALRCTTCLMPPAVAIIAGAALSATTITLAGGLALSFSLGTFLVSAALGFALQLLAPKPPGSPPDAGYDVNSTGGRNPHAIIYGETVVGGPVFYDETTDGNKFLNRLIALAGHECDAVNAVYLDDEELTLDGSGNITAPSKWAGFGRIITHLGDQTTADADLVSESEGDWTADHKAQGICYLYARLKFSRDAFPRGVPKITARVRGKKVHDPRSGLTAWSDNAALCARDYFRAAYGLQATGTDDTAYSAAANICDEAVSLSAGGTENRYTINGSFTLSSTPRQIVKSMHEAMAGYPVFGQGEWKSVTGAFVSATKSLNEDDLRSGISVVPRHKRADNFNSVTGIFKGDESNWKETSYPSIESTTFLNEDNGLVNAADFPLPFTDTSTAAQRIGKIALFRNREQLSFTAKFGLNAFDVAVGDTVQFTYTRWGWSTKEFECVGWKFTVEESGDLIVELTLREISSGVFDWDAEEQVFTANNTNLPDAWITSPVAIALSSELRVIAENVSGVIIIDATASEAGFVSQFEVEYKKSVDTEWISLGVAAGGKFLIIDVEDALFDVRARSINTFGVRGDWTQVDDFQSDAFLAPPVNVSNFAVNVVAGAAHFTWDANTDLDLSYYVIRRGTSWSDSITLAPKVPRPATSITLPAMDGTYFIKAVDKTGNQSSAATSIQMSLTTFEGFNAVETLIEDPVFLGAGTLWDDVPGLWDDVTGLWDDINNESVTLFGGGVVIKDVSSAPSQGIYKLPDVIDLGQTYNSQVSFSITVTRSDNGSGLWDDISGLWDDVAGLWDGDSANVNDVNVTLQISTTNDDPNISPTWGAWQDFIVGSYDARAFRFRAILDSNTVNVTPAISALSVTIDMPDRVIAGNDISSGTGGKVVAFTPRFKALSGLGIAAQDLATGDRYAITGKTATGFTIEFFNSGAASIDKTFDYIARGYGKETA